MPRKPTYAELQARVSYLERTEHLLSRALQCTLNHQTEFPVSFFSKDVVPDEPGRYTFRFFDQDSPDCEKVIVSYALAGQQTYHVVYDVDQQRSWIQQNPIAVWSRIFYHALANRKIRRAA